MSDPVDDSGELAKLGYAQELLRSMGPFQNFALSFSIISILTGAVTLYGDGLKWGGPLVMSVGWPIVAVFTCFIAASLAELASAFPTAGALYHWASILGGPGAGWATAWLNTLGQFAVTAAIDFGLAKFLAPLLGLEASRSNVLPLFTGLLLSHALLNHVGVRLVSALNTVSAWYHVAGVLVVADEIKATTREALDRLRHDGVRIFMLTGDRLAAAKAVAEILGIADFVAGMLPEDKIAFVRRLQKEGRRVAMAGDGINDAPALTQADVGIAMGTGSGIAMESASVTLVKGDLRGIGRALQLSRAAVRNIRQNLFFAFFYNVLGVPVAAGVLFPFTGMLLNPVIAGAAMSLSSVSVIGNALRLRRLRLV